ncbi:hypothetical protein DJ568_07055 [Mucilaginibacter hurinus]|uniref:Outer membrane protein beta-barrel domain-containing protein n=1 Tax=Mucilaginibacter hurinus TaxID=2201324 RepID=A0A367GQB3_9SPHI|nr:outer membrane beta-barrel protein [Mucilaginibacter hurinus]RCH55639.1 hypothetical protein DJ568_07055 [Mucilaginibacter hurinus]
MKLLLLLLGCLLFSLTPTHAQNGIEVRGTVIDSTKLSVPGASVKLTSEQGDSTLTAADMNGSFAFSAVKGRKIRITVTSIGFQAIAKRYSLEADTGVVVLDPIIMQFESNQLGQVTITAAANPVVLKEDTVEYKVSSYKVRDNAPVEDVLRKLPGVDVDKDGNVTAQGQQVTRVRLNGKDFYGGDLQAATKNLPADIIESIQIVDDYGDQANLTGIRTGEATKIININVREDKNYGYSLQATAGDGSDALPNDPGVSNKNRYIGTLNFFKFKDDQQIAVLGNLNNTNVNTFSYGAATGGGFGGNFGSGGFGGGGGRGRRAMGGNSGQTTNANGITNARSLGINFRDEIGKKLSIYGSYSFSDNTTYTNSNDFQLSRFVNPLTSRSTSSDTSSVLNHRLNFNIEYSPDSMNYIKIVPTFSYADNTSGSFSEVSSARSDVTNLAYTVNSFTQTTSPNFSISGLFNHKFNTKGRNFNINLNYSTAKNDRYDNPIYDYTIGVPTTPLNQRVNTNSRTSTFGARFSYIEPLSKVSFLEFNYAFNRSLTNTDKRTDTLAYTGAVPPLNYSDADFNRYDLLSNRYNYTFTTNRVGLNYRFVEEKYNYILGLGVQPGSLRGNSVNAPQTVRNTFNIVPVARFSYKFSRNKSLNINYRGENNQPSFNQLQPVLDLSNALYPVLGNPNLKPEFTNDFNIRFNNFSFESGNTFFTRLSFTQTNDKVVSQTTTYPTTFAASALAADPSLKNLQNTNLTTYTNTGGYYNAQAFAAFSKPWAERKYTLSIGGRVQYSNNIGFSNSVDSLNRAAAFEKNISKNLVFSPNLRFRVNIDDVMDTEFNTSYSINKTVSSINNNNPLFGQNTNARTLNLGINGKNYFWKDWTLSYDFTRQVNYGYNVPVTNPNILNVYVERRFLKNNMATIRLQGFDLFNQNRGFSSSDDGITTTQRNTNRLSRYFLLTFTLRLQKFAGKAPAGQDGPGSDERRGGGNGRPQGLM